MYNSVNKKPLYERSFILEYESIKSIDLAIIVEITKQFIPYPLGEGDPCAFSPQAYKSGP